MIKLVKKDLKLFFGNKRDMLLTFALPIIIITLFASVFGRISNTEEGNLGGLVQSVAGTAVMMLLFSVAAIGASFLEEKHEGMLKKLICSPLPPDHFLYGKLIFANIISVTQLIIMFVYAWLVFGLDIIHHLPSLALIILATAYACSSFGVLLASFAKTTQQVQGLSTVIVLVMSGIGGSMMPLFLMPDVMQKIAVISVNYWGIQGVFDIFLEARSFTDLTFLSRVVVLFGMGTVLNFIALQLYKKNILNIA